MVVRPALLAPGRAQSTFTPPPLWGWQYESAFARSRGELLSTAKSLSVIALLTKLCYNFIKIFSVLTDEKEAITSQENTDTGNVVNSATFKLVPLSRKTFWGDAGSCTLDYLSQGYIQWTIQVPGVVIVSFEGNLHFNKLGTPFGTFDHSITSTSTSGTEDVKYGLSKGKWEVEFTGIATDAAGNMYSVVEGATLPFTVSK